MLRSGWLTAQIAGSTEPSSITAFATLSTAGVLTLLPAADADPSAALLASTLESCTVSVPDAAAAGGRRLSIAVTAADAGSSAGGSSTAPATLLLSCETPDDHEGWLTAIAVASVPRGWPGGVELSGAPRALAFEQWAAEHTPAGALAAARGLGSVGGGAGGRMEDGEDGSSSGGVGLPPLPLPFPTLPPLRSVPAWARRGLYLQKLRIVAVTFSDVSSLPDARGGFAADAKRDTLLEVLAALEEGDRAVFGGGGGPEAAAIAARVADDTFTALRLNVCRPLPCPVATAAAASASGGAKGESGELPPFCDPAWPHLCIAYECLLKALNADAIDLSAKKRAFGPDVLSCLVAAFASPDAREREVLKTLVHRLYTKLTQRRAAIRRTLCSFFASFLAAEAGRDGDGTPLAVSTVAGAETLGGPADVPAPPPPHTHLPPPQPHTAPASASARATLPGCHHPAGVWLPGGGGIVDVPPSTPAAQAVATGIAEALEIVASVANGFSLPLKEEHLTTLTRYLLPLHKAVTLEAFHPQLAYVCALYASKDKSAAVLIVAYLLRHWPRANTAKQTLLLAELEDVLEYTDPADCDAPLTGTGSAGGSRGGAPTVGRALVALLARCIGGTHFSVAERALLCFASQKVVDVVVSHPPCRAAAFGATGVPGALTNCLYAALLRNAAEHWHDGVKAMSGQLAAQFAETDPAAAGAVADALMRAAAPAAR